MVTGVLPLAIAAILSQDSAVTRPVLSAEDGCILLLQSTEVAERGRALAALLEAPSLQWESRVRSALVATLRSEVDADLRLAAQEKQSSRRYSERREQLSLLVRVVGENAWPEAVPSLVRADVYNVTASLFAMRGAPTADLVAELAQPPRPGVSSTYMEKRVDALRSIIERRLIPDEEAQSVKETLLRLLNERNDLSVLKASLRAVEILRDDVDVAERLLKLRQFVSASEDPELERLFRRVAPIDRF